MTKPIIRGSYPTATEVSALLPQPGGFEGGVTVEIDCDMTYSSSPAASRASCLVW
jgi:hypothetical protein